MIFNQYNTANRPYAPWTYNADAAILDHGPTLPETTSSRAGYAISEPHRLSEPMSHVSSASASDW